MSPGVDIEYTVMVLREVPTIPHDGNKRNLKILYSFFSMIRKALKNSKNNTDAKSLS